MSADLVVDDTGTKMRITCRKKSDNSVIDLTGAAVTIGWRNEADTADVEKTMAIVGVATDGVAEYQFLVGDLYANFMSFEFEITDAGGFILTGLDLVKQIVRDAIVA